MQKRAPEKVARKKSSPNDNWIYLSCRISLQPSFARRGTRKGRAFKTPLDLLQKIASNFRTKKGARKEHSSKGDTGRKSKYTFLKRMSRSWENLILKAREEEMKALKRRGEGLRVENRI